MPVADLIRRAEAAVRTKARSGGSNPAIGMGRIAAAGSVGRFGGDAGLISDSYTHYSGYFGSLVDVIANRVSSQPLRHGRLVAEGKLAPKAFRPRKDSVPGSVLKTTEANVRMLTDSPILEAFRRPNPIMVRSMLWKVTVIGLKCVGRAYWWLRQPDEDSEDGWDTPEIWPLPAHWVQPVHEDAKGNPRLYDHWEVIPAGGAERFAIPAGHIVYFNEPDPADPLSAMSNLQRLAKTVMADESVEEAQRRSFLNTMNPGLAVTIGQAAEASGVGQADSPVLTRAQRKALRVMLKEEYRGTVNYGEPFILDGYMKDIKNIFPNPKEMDFLRSSETTKGRLSQGMSVNPIVMGQVENANRASSSVADDHFCQNAVNPVISMISEVMSVRIPPFFTGRKDEIVYLEKAVSRDIDYELARDEAMVDRGAKGIGEWRTEHGLPRIKNGNRAFVQGGWEPVEVEEPGNEGGKRERPRPSGLKDAGTLIDLPDVRQPDDSSCGAASACAVGRYFRVGPESVEEWIEALGTSQATGTPPQAIVRYLRSLRLSVTDRQGMTVDDLQRAAAVGTPIICPIQDYGPSSQWSEEGWGHYVCVLGVGMGVVVVQDPSIDWVLDDSNVDQPPGRTLISLETWERVWHDQGADGTEYNHYGIVVGPGTHAAGTRPARHKIASRYDLKFQQSHWDREHARAEKAARDILVTTFRSLGEQAAVKLTDTPSALQATSAIDPLLWGKTLATALQQTTLEAVLVGAAGEWKMRAGFRRDENSLPSKVRRACLTYARSLLNPASWVRVAKTIRDTVRSAVGRAKEAGTSPGEAVREVLTGEQQVQAAAERNAGPVAAAAVQGGRHQAYDLLLRAGRVQGRRWVTVRDSRVRHDHRLMHGKVAYGHEPFVVGGEEAMFPGDPNLSPGQRCNCRCISISVS